MMPQINIKEMRYQNLPAVHIFRGLGFRFGVFILPKLILQLLFVSVTVKKGFLPP